MERASCCKQQVHRGYFVCPHQWVTDTNCSLVKNWLKQFPGLGEVSLLPSFFKLLLGLL